MRTAVGSLLAGILACTMANPSYEPSWGEIAGSVDLRLSVSGEDAPPGCALSLAGARDFSIRFDLVAVPTAGYRPLLNQRAVCDLSEPFWDVIIHSDGTILVHTNRLANGASILTLLYGKTRVDDGVLHHIAVERRGGVLSTAIDGRVDALIFESADFGDALPPLKVGRGDYCGAVVAEGAVVSNVCLTLTR